MTALSRSFLAVYPPSHVLDAVEERRSAMPVVDGVRWVPRDQWHVTVRFCGRLPDAEALVDAVGVALSAMAPVEGLRLLGAGAFPKPRRGSVLWIGCEDGAATDRLGTVAAAVEGACLTGGLPPEDRAFRPHLTLARWERPHDLRPLVAALGGAPMGGPWTVRDVRLVASETLPTGAVHAEVARIPLGG